MIEFDFRNWFWIVGGDESRVYASARAMFVPVDDQIYCDTFLAQGGRPSRVDSVSELIAAFRAANVPPYHTVSSYRIVRRLEESGVAEVALQVIDAPQNAVLKARFYTLGAIPADDPDAIALITATGADPDVILAPH